MALGGCLCLGKVLHQQVKICVIGGMLLRIAPESILPGRWGCLLCEEVLDSLKYFVIVQVLVASLQLHPFLIVGMSLSRSLDHNQEHIDHSVFTH